MSDVKIFTDNIEDTAREQINELISQPVFKNAKIRIMPDVHAGKGCVIGFTADLGNKVVPNLVGVDIGCGMLTVHLGKKDTFCEDLSLIDKVIRESIPSGRNVHEKPIYNIDDIIDKLYCRRYLKNIDHIRKSVGTLGGGNHFIEIDESSSGDLYLIIHSGSRNLGKQVADYYQDLAVKYCKGSDKLSRERLISEYKSSGRECEIESALHDLKLKENNIPDHLAYLDGEYRNQYLHDMRLCQKFAHINRMEIAGQLVGVDLAYYGCFSTIHNYIDFESNIIRKGAISARAGERVLIPLNMRDGCILGIGKGNPDWNNSAPHGAGRLMSRNEAKKSITLDTFKNSMSGIFTTCITDSTIDESPFAYKPAEEIIDKISDTVEIIEVLKPIYNFKATEE